MNKKLYIIALLTLFLGAPVSVCAEEMFAPEEEVITFTIKGRTVHAFGAEGEKLQVYNLAGVLVESVYIDSADKVITLNLSKGCYVLKIGDVTRKLSIR